MGVARARAPAITRFERSLQTGDPGLIVPAALELPRVAISDGVRILLSIVSGGRELDMPSWRSSYDGIAVRFGTVVARRLELRLDETQLLFASLQALRSPRPDAGAAAIEQILEAHQQNAAAAYVGEWLRLREGGVVSDPKLIRSNAHLAR